MREQDDLGETFCPRCGVAMNRHQPDDPDACVNALRWRNNELRQSLKIATTTQANLHDQLRKEQAEKHTLREELAEAQATHTDLMTRFGQEVAEERRENARLNGELAEARQQNDALMEDNEKLVTDAIPMVKERDAAFALLREAEYWSTPEIDRGPASPKWVAFRARIDALIKEMH